MYGMAIAEPSDIEQFESRDARALTTAYVPVGSVERGRVLAMTGEVGKTLVCDICHGVGPIGSAIAPVLAGRSPTYLVRQLYDFKNGKREGAMSGPMAPTVKNLSIDDMLSLAAYASSLKP
jgi:cytochrome c553